VPIKYLQKELCTSPIVSHLKQIGIILTASVKVNQNSANHIFGIIYGIFGIS
jgi:hypothetical protein